MSERGRYESNAESIAAQVSIDGSDGRVQVSGPKNTMYQNWSLSYEIFLPHTADLALNTANGALAITDVEGHIQFNIADGAVSLVRLAGQVAGKIANGALAITLGGDHWDGPGLDAKTANGAITINTPHDYSAHFDASTTVGTASTNYPVAVQTATASGESRDWAAALPSMPVSAAPPSACPGL